LSELAHAVAALASGRRTRATAQICADDQAWEIGLEADGIHTLLTVFRGGACPEVAVHERRVETETLRTGVLEALDRALEGPVPPNVAAFLESARIQLRAAPQSPKRLTRRLTTDCIEIEPVGGIQLSARAAFRTSEPKPSHGAEAVERSDLHSLLVRGALRISSQGRSITLERA